MVEREILNLDKIIILLHTNKGEIWWLQLVKTINKTSSSSSLIFKTTLIQKINIRTLNRINNNSTQPFNLIRIRTTKKINRNTKKITKRTRKNLNLFNFTYLLLFINFSWLFFVFLKFLINYKNSSYYKIINFFR